MALDLSQYTNVSDPRRRAQTFNLGGLFVDQEGGWSRDADGQRYWDPEGTAIQNSFYLGGAPGAGTKLMRLDDLNADAQSHYLNTGQAFDLNGMKFITEADALPVWQALGGGADGVNQIISDYAVPALMALTGAAAGGTFGDLSTFGNAGGTFGAAAGGNAISAADAALLDNAIATQGMGGMSATGAGTTAGGFVGGAGGGGALSGETVAGLGQLTGGASGAGSVGATGGGLLTGAGGAALPWATPAAGLGISAGGQILGDAVQQGSGGGGNWWDSFAPKGINLGNVLQGLAQGGLGYLGADKMADAYTGIQSQLRADRAPALSAFNTALADPNSWYASAPAMGAVDSVMRRLSVQGNPANNPGLLAQGAAYNLGGYNDYLRALSGPAFGTASTEANVGMNSAGAQGGGLNALGYGLNTALQQPSPIDDYYRAMTRRLNTGMPMNGILNPV